MAASAVTSVVWWLNSSYRRRPVVGHILYETWLHDGLSAGVIDVTKLQLGVYKISATATHCPCHFVDLDG